MLKIITNEIPKFNPGSYEQKPNAEVESANDAKKTLGSTTRSLWCPQIETTLYKALNFCQDTISSSQNLYFLFSKYLHFFSP